MNTISTAVQPSSGRQSTEPSKPQSHTYVAQLVKSGGDAVAAEKLVERLTRGKPPADKYEAAAMQSFIGLVGALSSSGGRLTSVS